MPTGTCTRRGILFHELEFDVTRAVDVMTDLDAEVHNNRITKVLPRMAETGTAAEIVQLPDKTRNR